jgi:hypothetical protein
MVQELLNLLPRDVGTLGMVIAIAGSMVGVGMWLIGSRFSRPIITLLTVLLGASVGMQLPKWLGWSISGAGPAVGGAVVLGVTGFVLHGMWVGIGLGAVLSSWVALGCWIMLRNGAAWTWPIIGPQTTLGTFLHEVWIGMPPDVTRILPYACATAMITGLAITIIWPKVSLVLCWSMAGVTLLTCMGIAAVEFGQPQWLTNIPQPMWAQASMVGLLVTLGSLIQWKLSPKPVAEPSRDPKSGKKRERRDDDWDDDMDDDD